ncbi:putative receptor-like protein kinase [Morus notabilis]|uniref:non-specific serine/threonine protein kinase n=2 Tax=Morus notabilis TaxID=981085 RepID=W9S0Y3_9ROSA|nr:putative receptor-like protein kinase [Morus notabilis]
MNQKLSIMSSHLLVLFCFALLIFDKIPLSASFGWYTTCSNKYRCGAIEADFPFVGDGRPEGCGHPGLKLNCEKNNATIYIKGVKYQVLEVDQNAQIFKIARTDYMNGICVPQYGNTSLDPELFEYAPASGDITLLYGCSPEKNSYIGGFNCSASGKGFILPGNSTSGGAELVCRSRVIARVPDPVRNYGELGNVSVISKALAEGFPVKYKVDFEACEECKNSSGVCGYDGRLNQTTCYCQNELSLGNRTCPPTPGSGDGGGDLEVPGAKTGT